MNIRRRRLLLVCALLALGPRMVCADGIFGAREDPDAPPWQEREVTLPAFPKDDDLIEFYVSATTANRFFVDAKSIDAGGDGVVRYALVIRTAGGATNVSYEGIRCERMEYRLYASGRADGNWAKVRSADWKPIENKPINRHHAALNRSYFCPGGVAIRSADEGRDALRRGRHPDAN